MPFPITCTACQKTFSIADDVYERKVKGRVVTIKCKQCQAGIRVDGTADTPIASTSDSVRPPPVASSAANAAAPPIEPAAAPLAAAPKAAPLAAESKATPTVTPKAAAPFAAAPKGVAPSAAAPKAAAVVTPKAVAPSAATPKGAAPRAPLAAAPRAPFATASKAAGFAAKAPIAAPTPPTAAPAEPAPAPAEAALIEPGGTSAAPTEALWAVDYPDGEDRELTLSEIGKELAAGKVTPSTLVWREGMGEWLELSQVPELKGLVAPPKAAVAEPAAPPPAPAPPAPPAQRPKAPSTSGIELPKLAGALPKPPAASAPVIDFALHEAISSAPPPAPKPRQPTIAGIGGLVMPATPAAAFPAAPAFPPGPGLPTGLGFPEAAAPTFSAAPVMVPAPALAAPFAAPVQPFGRPSPTPVGAVAPVANIPDWPQKKSRAPLVIAAVALLAIGGGLFVALKSSDDKSPPPTPISALPAAAPTAPRTVATSTPTADAPSATGEGPGSGAALEPPTSAPTATPNAGFAELFATGARHADDKKGPGGPAQRFDPNAAKTALAAAAFETAKCREKGGPTGKATIVVTFEPSGKVASATVSDPPFAGTSSGACIAGAMKRATVPAFSGLPGTVTKIISIQ